MVTQDQVEAFLRNLREKIRFSDVAFRPREKNLKFLADIDLIPIERIEYLKKLTYENYKSGPNKDTHDSTRPDYWEFGIEIKGVEAYIKVSLGIKDKRVDCMSFHEAEMLITYPLKERKK